MIRHDGSGGIGIAVALSPDQRLLMVMSLLPKLDVWWRTEAAIHRQIGQQVHHEIDNKAEQWVFGLFRQNRMESE